MDNHNYISGRTILLHDLFLIYFILDFESNFCISSRFKKSIENFPRQIVDQKTQNARIFQNRCAKST